jgi:hypothetical protein
MHPNVLDVTNVNTLDGDMLKRTIKRAVRYPKSCVESLNASEIVIVHLTETKDSSVFCAIPAIRGSRR